MKTTTLKTFIAIFCIAVLSTAANAQTTATKEKSSIDSWTELKEFHKVMAQTFHPMEDGNYKPIRERSGEMLEKAMALSASKVPAEFNKPEMLRAIQELAVGSRKLNAMVESKAKDEEINKSLTALHDTFHKIAGLCQPGDKHDEHHHDHSDPNHKH